MKENQIQQTTEFYKICAICNKSILDINLEYIQNSKQKRKLKENFKYIRPSELIKKCNCKNIKKDINNNNDLYYHKYCILLNIIYKFEIKCEKCNTLYNIKIKKKFHSKRKFFFYFRFLFFYIIHLALYILCIVSLFIRTFKDCISKKLNYLPYFFVIIIFIINSIFLYFTIIYNIGQYKYIFSYTIDIYNINIFNVTNKYYELIYDYFIWFYENSKKLLLIDKYKNYIINKEDYNFKKKIREYIKENNIQYINFIKIKNNNENNIININIKDSKKINNEKYNIDNILTMQNNSKKENDNLLDNITLNKKNEIKIENNNTNNIMDELYSDRTDNNDNNNNDSNYDLNENKDAINMTSLNDFNTDKINININPIQAKNVNININFNNNLNNNFKDISNEEHNELYFFPSNYFHGSNGKTALISNNKNFMNKLIDDNIYKNYIKQRKQIKSIKLKQKDIKLIDKKIIGNIEENEEIDFSEFEKGKVDSKISKEIKLYHFRNSGSANDLFKTKKSYKDVTLNLSNPTDSNICDDLVNNRFSLKNNIVAKNANFSNSNLFHYIKH